MSFKKKNRRKSLKKTEHSTVFVWLASTSRPTNPKSLFFFAATSFTGRRYDGDGILTDERVDWNESS